MWNHLPCDLLGKIFSLLPPDSLACAASTCRDWLSYIRCPHPSRTTRCNPPWFLAIALKHHGPSCYAYNSALQRWYVLTLDFLPYLVHPIAAIGNVVLCRPANSSLFQLALFNPFTKQFKFLPPLNTRRTTPALGLHQDALSLYFHFRIFVAGGMSASGSSEGGASYESTLEMYDSQVNKWETIGVVPTEFAVRLTVWTPNESVYSMGVLYWITSARAYSIMGFNVGSRLWKEVNVPMANRLECAALVQRKGRLTLIGGKSGGEACIWELGEGDAWILIERVPVELGKRFMGCKGSWCSTKCVGSDEGVYLYKDLSSRMLVWMDVKGKEGNGKWEWFWVESYCPDRGPQGPKFSIKGVLLHPNLGPSVESAENGSSATSNRF
ncbi:hypothetical protein ACHQM5_002465 [Ranunculus cassubicifolius]